MFDYYSSSCEILHFSLYYSLYYNDREVCGNLDERDQSIIIIGKGTKHLCLYKDRT